MPANRKIINTVALTYGSGLTDNPTEWTKIGQNYQILICDMGIEAGGGGGLAAVKAEDPANPTKIFVYRNVLITQELQDGVVFTGRTTIARTSTKDGAVAFPSTLDGTYDVEWANQIPLDGTGTPYRHPGAGGQQSTSRIFNVTTQRAPLVDQMRDSCVFDIVNQPGVSGNIDGFFGDNGFMEDSKSGIPAAWFADQGITRLIFGTAMVDYAQELTSAFNTVSLQYMVNCGGLFEDEAGEWWVDLNDEGEPTPPAYLFEESCAIFDNGAQNSGFYGLPFWRFQLDHLRAYTRSDIVVSGRNGIDVGTTGVSKWEGDTARTERSGYHYFLATVALVIRTGRTVYAWYEDSSTANASTTKPVREEPAYFEVLGLPIDEGPGSNNTYQGVTGIYMREFENGYVFVNANAWVAGTEKTVTFPEAGRILTNAAAIAGTDPLTLPSVTSNVMEGNNGIFVLKSSYTGIVPTVVSTIPVADAVDVPINNTVSALFNVDMIAGTFTITSFTLDEAPLAAYTVVPGVYTHASQATRGAYEKFAVTELTADLPKLLHVVNLNPGNTETGGMTYLSGPQAGLTKLGGTFEWCISRQYPRIIVFEVSGVINIGQLQLELDNVLHSFFHIVGQTAPGPIILHGLGFKLNAAITDFVVEHFIFRADNPTDTTPESLSFQSDGIDHAVAGIDKGVYDHISSSFANDEQWSARIGPNRLSLTRSLIGPAAMGTEKLDNTPSSITKGSLLRATKVTLANNIFVSCTARHPVIQPTVNIGIYNNISYNWGGSGDAYTALADGVGGGDFSIEQRGNVYKPGPDSTKLYADGYKMRVFSFLSNANDIDTTFYQADNIYRGVTYAGGTLALSDYGIQDGSPAAFIFGSAGIELPANFVLKTAADVDTSISTTINIGAHQNNRCPEDVTHIADLVNGTGANQTLPYTNPAINAPPTITGVEFVPNRDATAMHNMANANYTHLEQQLHVLAAALDN